MLAVEADRERFLVEGLRFVRTAELDEHVAQVVRDNGFVGGLAQGAAQDLLGLEVAPATVEHPTEGVLDVGVVRPQLERAAHEVLGLGETLVRVRPKVADEVQRADVLGVALDEPEHDVHGLAVAALFLEERALEVDQRLAVGVLGEPFAEKLPRLVASLRRGEEVHADFEEILGGRLDRGEDAAKHLERFLAAFGFFEGAETTAERFDVELGAVGDLGVVETRFLVVAEFLENRAKVKTNLVVLLVGHGFDDGLEFVGGALETTRLDEQERDLELVVEVGGLDAFEVLEGAKGFLEFLVLEVKLAELLVEGGAVGLFGEPRVGLERFLGLAHLLVEVSEVRAGLNEAAAVIDGFTVGRDRGRIVADLLLEAAQVEPGHGRFGIPLEVAFHALARGGVLLVLDFAQHDVEENLFVVGLLGEQREVDRLGLGAFLGHGVEIREQELGFAALGIEFEGATHERDAFLQATRLDVLLRERVVGVGRIGIELENAFERDRRFLVAPLRRELLAEQEVIRRVHPRRFLAELAFVRDDGLHDARKDPRRRREPRESERIEPGHARASGEAKHPYQRRAESHPDHLPSLRSNPRKTL